MAIFKLDNHIPTINNSAWVAESADVIGRVTLDEDVSIWPSVVVRGDIADIRVGKGSNIQDNSTVHTETETPCIIGENVTVGHNAVLHSCTIEDGALIGMGAIVLNRAVIGKDAIVGAGALVTEGKVIEPRALVVGSPARFVRYLTDEEIARQHFNTRHYVELKDEFKNKLERIG